METAIEGHPAVLQLFGRRSILILVCRQEVQHKMQQSISPLELIDCRIQATNIHIWGFWVSRRMILNRPFAFN